MNKRFSNKKQMLSATAKVLDDNRSKWVDSPIMLPLYNQLTAYINVISEIDSDASVTSTGITTDIRSVHDQLADETNHVSSAVYAYAYSKSNFTLLAVVDHSETEYHEARQSNLEKMSGDVLRVALENLTELEPYGITSANTDQLTALRESYKTTAPGTRTTISGRAASADMLADLFATATELLEHQIDPMMVVFRRNYPDFYAAYINARKIVNYGTRHNKKDDKTDTK